MGPNPFECAQPSAALSPQSRQGVDRSEHNNGDDDGQGDDSFHVDVGSQPRSLEQPGACFEMFQDTDAKPALRIAAANGAGRCRA
jgi:hypothetical protein